MTQQLEKRTIRGVDYTVRQLHLRKDEVGEMVSDRRVIQMNYGIGLVWSATNPACWYCFYPRENSIDFRLERREDHRWTLQFLGSSPPTFVGSGNSFREMVNTAYRKTAKILALVENGQICTVRNGLKVTYVMSSNEKAPEKSETASPYTSEWRRVRVPGRKGFPHVWDKGVTPPKEKLKFNNISTFFTVDKFVATDIVPARRRGLPMVDFRGRRIFTTHEIDRTTQNAQGTSARRWRVESGMCPVCAAKCKDTLMCSKKCAVEDGVMSNAGDPLNPLYASVGKYIERRFPRGL